MKTYYRCAYATAGACLLLALSQVLYYGSFNGLAGFFAVCFAVCWSVGRDVERRETERAADAPQKTRG